MKTAARKGAKAEPCAHPNDPEAPQLCGRRETGARIAPSVPSIGRVSSSGTHGRQRIARRGATAPFTRRCGTCVALIAAGCGLRALRASDSAGSPGIWGTPTIARYAGPERSRCNRLAGARKGAAAANANRRTERPGWLPSSGTEPAGKRRWSQKLECAQSPAEQRRRLGGRLNPRPPEVLWVHRMAKRLRADGDRPIERPCRST